ncbi:MAG: hypothetical protein NZ700_16935 [Gemmataceae bacterium]|nr:hypothetical protein [Gemmataceae bacterium]MDW8265378.1 hypothetical protein [Gemmataceae bacterium]
MRLALGIVGSVVLALGADPVREGPEDLLRAAEEQMAARPREALATAHEAATRLRNHPNLRRQLFAAAARISERRLTELDEAQVSQLSHLLEKELGDPARARGVCRRWCEDRRGKLAAGDAIGRLRLARAYRSWQIDTAPAAELLLEALQLDFSAVARELTFADLDLLGSPKRQSRQVLYRRYLEQRSYPAPVPFWVEIEFVRGEDPHLVTVRLDPFGD